MAMCELQQGSLLSSPHATVPQASKVLVTLCLTRFGFTTGGFGARIWLFSCMKRSSKDKLPLLSWQGAQRWSAGRRRQSHSSSRSLLLIPTPLTGTRTEDARPRTPAYAGTDSMSQSLSGCTQLPQRPAVQQKLTRSSGRRRPEHRAGITPRC